MIANLQNIQEFTATILDEIATINARIAELNGSLESAKFVKVNEGGEYGYANYYDEQDAGEVEELEARRKELAQKFESDAFAENNLTPDAYDWICGYEPANKAVHDYAY